MSGSKHTRYATKIIGSEGLGKPLVLMGGNSTETGVVGPVARSGAFVELPDATSYTMTEDECLGAMRAAALGANSDVWALTGAVLDAYFGTPPVGTLGTFTLVNGDAAQTLTLQAAVGTTVFGATVAGVTSKTWYLIKTAADTFLYSLMQE